ncbi:hypothetical protein SDC9_168150 [bioreactor metagenome]|uniref:Uncharacterized protein n=1 Tax=bioreactor metagenome TaxID=1076179 RepID=A0A645G1S5_9ZZZZ
MQRQDALLQPLIDLAYRPGELAVMVERVAFQLGHLFHLEFRQSGCVRLRPNLQDNLGQLRSTGLDLRPTPFALLADETIQRERTGQEPALVLLQLVLEGLATQFAVVPSQGQIPEGMEEPGMHLFRVLAKRRFPFRRHRLRHDMLDRVVGGPDGLLWMGVVLQPFKQVGATRCVVEVLVGQHLCRLGAARKLPVGG